MHGLVATAARHPVLSNLLMAVILVGGVWGYTSLRAEVFPDVSRNQVSVQLPYPGATAAEVEEGVILKLEEAIEGVEGIDDVVAVAREGLAELTIDLEDGGESRRRQVMADIKDRVDGVEGLPEATEEAITREVLIKQPAALVVLAGPLSERSLRELAYEVKDDLRARGMSQLKLRGLREYEISIEVSEDALRAYGLRLADVAEVVRASSLNAPSGALKSRGEELKLEVRGRRYTGEEYADLTVLATEEGARVRLGDIARIVDGFSEDRIRGRLGGQPAVMIQVDVVEGDDTIEIAEDVKAYLAEKQPELPEGVQLALMGDFSRDIIDRIMLLLRNGWQGLLLLFGCLLLFLNVRLSLWVGAGIPIAFAFAGLLIYLAGQSLNMINLFGLILVLGIVVDDAIVVGENVFAHLQRGAEPMQAAIAGAQEVTWPVVAGVSTTIVAFLPLFFVDGVMGRFIEHMPLIVIATLIGSLVESLLILPNHLAHTRRPGRTPDQPSWGKRARDRLEARIQGFIGGPFTRLFKLSLRWRYTTLALAVVALLGSAGLIVGDFLRFIMLPKQDSVYVQSDLAFAAGTPFEVTAAAVDRLEAAAGRAQERLRGSASGPDGEPAGPFELVYAEAGGGEGLEHRATLVASLKPPESRSMHSEQVISVWREEMGALPGVRQLRFGQFGGVFAQDVELRLLGDDAERLEAAAGELVEALRVTPGVLDAETDSLPGKRELHASVTPRGRVLGVTSAHLADHLRPGFYGYEALEIQRGRDEVEVQVRYPLAERRSRAHLEAAQIRTPGGLVPFSEVARVEEVRGLFQIRRRNAQRQVTVTASVDEDATTPGEVTERLGLGALAEVRQRYPELEITVEGAAAESAETVLSLGRGYLFAACGIFGILALVFRSFVQPLLIMTVIPFGFVGAVLGHVVMGLPFTMLSVFGIVALTGVVVNDSLVLIDRVNRLQRRGRTVLESLELGSPSRFRAIMLTTLTTVSGLVPLMFEESFQAQFVIPMAVSLAGGLIVATALTLFVVPTLYLILNDARRAARWLVSGEWPTREEVEPAAREAR